jgi:hypothetical protein
MEEGRRLEHIKEVNAVIAACERNIAQPCVYGEQLAIWTKMLEEARTLLQTLNNLH